jgi:SAM-dependent methyltransferase
VGMPYKNPRALPFKHKEILAERVDDYDLFIYSEDDTLLSERNVQAFLDASAVLPGPMIPGFFRYEMDPRGRRFYTTAHGAFHWDPSSVQTYGDRTFAYFTNQHSACYILTRAQLKRAIDSGHYLAGPHKGRYQIQESAATDVYTRCGLKKMICISHFEDFTLPHLPNAYLGALGAESSEIERQIQFLRTNENSSRPFRALFDSHTKLDTARFDTAYYDPERKDILQLVPDGARRIVSIGCGCGRTEGALAKRGAEVFAVPLDDVIGGCAASKGITVLPADFQEARAALNGATFDCLLAPDLLHRLPDPAKILSLYTGLLKPGGRAIVSIPNFGSLGAWKCKIFARDSVRGIGEFKTSGLHSGAGRSMPAWFRLSGLRLIDKVYSPNKRHEASSQLLLSVFSFALSDKTIFVGERK